jgi:hypothetical protein
VPLASRRCYLGTPRRNDDQDKWQAACEVLASGYGWFTERFDARDLKEGQSVT